MNLAVSPGASAAIQSQISAPALIPRPRLWAPRQVQITPDALKLPHGRAILERAAALGSEIIELKSNRLQKMSDYAQAKTTLAVVSSPAGARKLQPIPPSADWQFHLASGCPAHCQYCYLAGSLSGPPVTRVYANIEEILEGLRPYGTAEKQTSFEASCYTDPLGIEHLTGSLAKAIRFFGEWDAPVHLRWTTKFDGVQPLLSLPHNRKTRVRFSVSAQEIARNFEGGTASPPNRIAALRQMAQAGYLVGLTIAPIMPVPSWQEQFRSLFRQVAVALEGVRDLDLTAEAITHRFTGKSKLVQIGWYPKTTLDLDEEKRAKKFTKFGSPKFVYKDAQMREMKAWFLDALREELPQARFLYWT